MVDKKLSQYQEQGITSNRKHPDAGQDHAARSEMKMLQGWFRGA
jgi:hypothetical protein